MMFRNGVSRFKRHVNWNKMLVFGVVLVAIACQSVDSMHARSSVGVVLSFDSPCPAVFGYAIDVNNEMYGKIEIRNPVGNVIRVDVELSLGNSVEGYNGEIKLAYDRQQVINDITNGKPLLYRVHFPAWRTYPPRVTKILLNGELICSGPPFNIKSVPVLTTINLRHELKINVIPLSGGSQDSPSPSFFDKLNANGQDAQNQGNLFGTALKNPFVPQDYEFTLPTVQSNPAAQYPFNPFFQSTTVQPSAQPPIQPAVQPDMPDHNINQVFTSNYPTTTTTEQVPEPLDIDIRQTQQNIDELCGKAVATTSLIAYGSDVIKGHHPWLVALYRIQNGLEFFCGGNLFSTKHVITAAHCMVRNGKKMNPDTLLAILGMHNLRQWGSASETEKTMITASEITIHRDYKTGSADADLAIITLESQVELKKSSRYIRPICLWSEPTDLNLVVGEKGIVAGWGKDESGVLNAAGARQVTFPIVSQEDCRSSQEGFAVITTDRTFCAGFRNGSGPCSGDSGGGFMMERNGRWTLRGLVSQSLANFDLSCDLKHYVIFTDVSKFLPWIRSFLNK